MNKIVITGAKGVIGSVLRRGLTDYDITSIDLPEVDVRNREKLLEIFPGHQAVVHLAWNKKVEDSNTDEIDPDNLFMAFNVYKAAMQAGVTRIIMASSVHTQDYCGWDSPKLITPDMLPTPDSPYGASKICVESLGRLYANRGLEVVCIRFGGVTLESRVDVEQGYDKVYLSHRDCVDLVRVCIEAPRIPNNFLIVHGISRNPKRVHDYTNPLGWQPKESVDDKIKD